MSSRPRHVYLLRNFDHNCNCRGFTFYFFNHLTVSSLYSLIPVVLPPGLLLSQLYRCRLEMFLHFAGGFSTLSVNMARYLPRHFISFCSYKWSPFSYFSTFEVSQRWMLHWINLFCHQLFGRLFLDSNYFGMPCLLG